jgi:arylsulfatase A-like enzyme
MTRPAFHRFRQIAVAPLVACIVVAALCGSTFAAKRPNIIFIFTDDHAAHAMSAYGSKVNKTPNLDRIANEGMLFTNCYCTNSICGPSRAVILTGKHSHLNGFRQNGNRFDGTQQTFPKLLQKVGYQTAVIGKWHLASEPTGFDYHEVLIGQGPYYNPAMRKNGKRVKHTGYTTEIITDLALDWLKEGRDQGKPFMLMYQHKAPHRNWQPGPKYLNMYDDVTIPEPDNLFDNYEGRGTAARMQDMSIAKTMTPNDLKLTQPRGFTPEQLKVWNAAYRPKNKVFREAKLEGKELIRWKYQRYMKDYLRCVAAVDDNVGRVLDYLESTGLAENTIVIYSSDQGFYLGDHGWFDKRFMYEESYRMPLAARWPGKVQPGTINTDLVSNLDFAETFLEIAGVEVPADMQGQSLVPLLTAKKKADPKRVAELRKLMAASGNGLVPPAMTDPTPGWRNSLYYHYYEYYPNRRAAHEVRRHYGVRSQQYKLIHFYNVDEWELYDLQKDPREMRSVYGDADYADVVKTLTTEVKKLQDQYDVPDDRGSVPKVPERYKKK